LHHQNKPNKTKKKERTFIMSEEQFQYTYSNEQAKEAEEIRKKYMPKEQDKFEQLKALDRKAEKKGMASSLALGIGGALVMGVGMCCTMVWAGSLFVPGVIIGIVGICILGAAYPVYRKLTKREREKVAAQIFALADEIR